MPKRVPARSTCARRGCRDNHERPVQVGYFHLGVFLNAGEPKAAREPIERIGRPSLVAEELGTTTLRDLQGESAASAAPMASKRGKEHAQPLLLPLLLLLLLGLWLKMKLGDLARPQRIKGEARGRGRGRRARTWRGARRPWGDG